MIPAQIDFRWQDRLRLKNFGYYQTLQEGVWSFEFTTVLELELL